MLSTDHRIQILFTTLIVTFMNHPASEQPPIEVSHHLSESIKLALRS